MVNLRLLVRQDQPLMLEEDWGMPVIIKGPQSGVGAGETQELEGQVLHSYMSFNPDTGEPVIVQKPVVTLRISALAPAPKEGEIWSFQIPSTSDPSSAKVLVMLDTSKSPEFNITFDHAKYRLTQAEQSTP